MSTNPILSAIKSGQAPRMAKLAAARGMLPLGPEESLEALVALGGDEDEEVRAAAASSLEGFNAAKLRPIVENPDVPPEVLGFLANWQAFPRELYQPLIFHRAIPDEALELLAKTARSGEVVEVISLKQQSLIRCPGIIDAILGNPVRTPEAERRAREVREEFFEKEYGAQLVAEEQRAQTAPEEAEPEPTPSTFYDDLLQFIEPDLLDSGQELMLRFEEQYGPIADGKDEVGETIDLNALLLDETFERLLEDDTPERVSVLARIVRMTVKERIQFALKGTREVRMILVRDPNRQVAAAVINNPRITDNEIEAICNLRSVHEEVLRLIGAHRLWARNYSVIHNLVRNPKTPIPTTMNFLNRIQSRDLRQLSRNKNVPESVRTMAARIYTKRSQG
jgi:hypothetical protein